MKNREDFLDEAVEKIINRDDLIYIDDNGLVKYKFTQSEIKEMVDDECDDLFEEYKADEEFEDSDVMDTPLRKAMRDAGMKESDFR
jgi:hypothetical protein